MDNIPTYIDVKHGRAQADYLHPLLEPVLRETYGVIIYQEQVQKIAQLLSGYTLGGADLLRRAMGKKIKAEMDAQRALFVEGARRNNVKEQQASTIFDLVAKFAGYGFNKSHAAAYAVIAYQTAYLKANYTVEFLAASMTYEMVSTDKLSLFMAEAKKFGVSVLPPDINRSQVEFSVETISCSLLEGEQNPQSGFGGGMGASSNSNIPFRENSPHASPAAQPLPLKGGVGKSAIRYALAAIKNVGAAAMEVIIAEREANGPFKDIQDFALRVDAASINRRQLEHLITAGCFDSLHPNRHQLYESVDGLLAMAQHATEERTSSQVSLFGDASSQQQMNRHVLKHIEEWPVVEKLNQECAAIGFYLTAHPLEPYAPVFKRLGVSPSSRAETGLTDRQTLKLAGILTALKFRNSPRGRSAFLSLSDAHGQYEVSVFDEGLLNQHHAILKAGTPLFLHIDVRMGERGQRLLVTKIDLLEEVAGQVKAQAVSITLEENADLVRLKQKLGTPKDRGARVELLVPTPTGTIKLALAGCYPIATQELLQLQTLPGIQAEAA